MTILQKQKLAWFAGYIALSAQRNIIKKHISASLMVNFILALKTFVNYYNYFDQHIFMEC